MKKEIKEDKWENKKWKCPDCGYLNIKWEMYCKGCQKVWGNFPTPQIRKPLT